jgi:hypothetical protein
MKDGDIMLNANNEFYQNSMINARKDNDEWRNADGTCSPKLIENQIHSVYCSVADSTFALFWSNNGEYDLSNSGLEHLSYCVLCDPAVAIEVNNVVTTYYEFTPGESFVVTNNGTPVTLSGDEVTPNDGLAYTLRIGGGPTGETIYTITKNDDIFEITIS